MPKKAIERDIEIGKRVASRQLHQYGDTHQAIASAFGMMYKKYFTEMCRRIEDSHYFHNYVISKYIYKGYGVERETRRLLDENDDYSEIVDNVDVTKYMDSPYVIEEAGRGQLALLMSLVHPNIRVIACCSDPDDAALLSSMQPKPNNLQVELKTT
jgi:hypothetical protein